MGRALAAIHATLLPAELPSARTWVRWTMQSERARGSWVGAHPEARAIEEAITSVGDRPLRGAAVLSHGDFGAGNVLWSHGRLSGVIDWETAEAAPRGADVGACLIDCAVTGGSAMAEAFLEGYGSSVEDLWFWELLTALKFALLYVEWLPIWQSLGMAELQEATVRKRLDDAIDDALRRVC